MTVEQVINARISTTPAVLALVDEANIRTTRLVQSTRYPAIRVALAVEGKDQHLMGGVNGGAPAIVQVDAYVDESGGDDPDGEAAAIMAAVEGALFPEPFDDGGSPVTLQVTGALPQGRSTGYESTPETRLVKSMQQFRVWWRTVN